MRIVSLLPSTTEVLFALGAGDQVVGVTFECDYPPEARQRCIVSTSTLPVGLAPAAIDAVVAERLAAGEDLYHLDRGALAGLDADLVVTQDLCAVCAVDVTEVDDALEYLACDADVRTIDPHDLAGVLESIRVLGKATGTQERADELVAALDDRLDVVRRRVTGRPPVRALVLEWTDPPFAPGHWVPEMVTHAGGTNVLGVAGRSRTARRGTPSLVSRRRSSSAHRVASAWTSRRGWPLTSPPRECCRRASRCGPWTRTRRSPGRVRG